MFEKLFGFGARVKEHEELMLRIDKVHLMVDVLENQREALGVALDNQLQLYRDKTGEAHADPGLSSSAIMNTAAVETHTKFITEQIQKGRDIEDVAKIVDMRPETLKAVVLGTGLSTDPEKERGLER